jgi:hypothetical protein
MIKKPKAYWQFYSQQASARSRIDCQGNPIEFNLTFDQWFKIWQDSGHWEQRGIRKGQYCMSRYNDIGNYEVGNVFIQPVQQNTKDAIKAGIVGNKNIPHTTETKSKIGIANGRQVKTPIGVFHSCKAAGRALNMTGEGVAHRIKTKPQEYSYID